jgi:Protein of unknown function (DUF4038)/Putative collagen-binding domain of a collagenase
MRMRHIAVLTAAIGTALVVALLGFLLLGSSTATSAEIHPSSRSPTRAQSHAAGGPAYPLKVGPTRRYLVDRRGRPFLIVGDSPQALIANLSAQDAAAFIANRKAAGFNSLWVNLLCVKYTGCRDDGTTIDGIKPFTTPGDLSTPNPAYFARADAIIRLAAKAGMVVFLDPIETGGWLSTLQANGLAKDYAYGQFLGRRYRKFGNLVWMSGNDFQTWSKASDDAVVLAVARGIRSQDPTHIQTVELNYVNSASLDDVRWKAVIGLDAAYTYLPTYAEVLKEYNRKDFLPVFMVEAGYELEQNSSAISPGNPYVLRRQEYWSMLAGATGQFYGNHFTWQFADGWKQNLDTPGTVQMGYLVKLFAGRPWSQLVPDQAHKIVTAGYGTFASSGNVESSNYVTTAATPGGSLALSYLPAGGTITVDMARLAGPVQANWYDPANGRYSAVTGSPFANSKAVELAPPGNNADGNPDWVLVLTAR